MFCLYLLQSLHFSQWHDMVSVAYLFIQRHYFSLLLVTWKVSCLFVCFLPIFKCIYGWDHWFEAVHLGCGWSCALWWERGRQRAAQPCGWASGGPSGGSAASQPDPVCLLVPVHPAAAWSYWACPMTSHTCKYRCTIISSKHGRAWWNSSLRDIIYKPTL